MNRNNNASISAQAQSLKRSLENRQQRRQADKLQRHLDSQDVYEGRQASQASQPGASTVASLAAISALPAPQQEVIHCELCQANFMTDASWKQHVEGPVHCKALEKQEAERVRQERMQQAGLNDVTEMALGAAGWHSQWNADGRATSISGWPPNSRPTGPSHHHHPRPQQQQQHGRTGIHGLSIRQQQQRQEQEQAEQLRRQGEIMSHEQVLLAARQDEEEVPNIDGWVPPGISLTLATPASPPHQSAALPTSNPQQHTTSPSQDREETAAAAANAASAAAQCAGEPSSSLSSSADSSSNCQQDTNVLPAVAHEARGQAGASGAATAESQPASLGGGLLGLAYGDGEDENSSSSSGSDTEQDQPITSFF